MNEPKKENGTRESLEEIDRQIAAARRNLGQLRERANAASEEYREGLDTLNSLLAARVSIRRIAAGEASGEQTGDKDAAGYYRTTTGEFLSSQGIPRHFSAEENASWCNRQTAFNSGLFAGLGRLRAEKDHREQQAEAAERGQTGDRPDPEAGEPETA